MLKTHYYLDTRATGENKPAPIKLAISKRKHTSFLSTGVSVLPEQWDKVTQKIVKHPHRVRLNSYLQGYQFKADTYLQNMVLSGEAQPLSALQLKDKLDNLFHGEDSGVTLQDFWDKVASGSKVNTYYSYKSAWAAICKADTHASTRQMEYLSPEWAEMVCNHIKESFAPNTAGLYMAKLKSVLQKAVREHIISSNPTDGIRNPHSPTKKRNLSQEQMHLFLTSPADDETEQMALDFFKFSFYTRASNPVDIWKASPKDIFNGRYYYNRSKTGKAYSIKIEPELQELLDKYQTPDWLFSPSHKYHSIASWQVIVNKALSVRSQSLGLPKVSMYWCRHTFASIALELGNTMDLISASLGHSLGGAAITSVYTSVTDMQVDALARSVYDAVK